MPAAGAACFGAGIRDAGKRPHSCRSGYAVLTATIRFNVFLAWETPMTKATSLSNATALRDEVVAYPPIRQRMRWTVRMAIAAPDVDRGDPAEPPFRRVDPVAPDLRPESGGRLAWPACTSVARNPPRSRWDRACADRCSLGCSRLCAHARTAPGTKSSFVRRRIMTSHRCEAKSFDFAWR
jgi:hypothetical protein